MLRRAGIASILLLLLSTASAAGSTIRINVTGIHFPPGTSIGLGDTVEWANNSPQPHTVTSDPRFSLWNIALPIGATRSRTFKLAGSFPYYCVIHGAALMHGNIHVPMRAVPAQGTTSTSFSIRVATVRAPAGLAFVIQRRAPGGTFRLWKTITRKATAFTTGTAGTWSFRVRVKRTSNGTHSGWSPVLKVRVMR
jgi:plastocyanin